MLNKIWVNACVLGPSLNLSQHIDGEQGRGKCLCGVHALNHSQHIDVDSPNLSQHIDVEQDRGKRLCFGDLL